MGNKKPKGSKVKNIEHKVLTMPTHQVDDGEGGTNTVPTIPGGVLYDVGDGWIVVYAAAVNRVHRAIAFARLVRAGKYLVIADKDLIKSIDKTNQGKTVAQDGLDWRIWRFEGSEPDIDPEAEPGATVDVTDGLHVFPGNAPDMSAASNANQIDLPGGKKVKKAWPSLDSTIAGYDLVAVVEPAGSRSVLGG